MVVLQLIVVPMRSMSARLDSVRVSMRVCRCRISNGCAAMPIVSESGFSLR